MAESDKADEFNAQGLCSTTRERVSYDKYWREGQQIPVQSCCWFCLRSIITCSPNLEKMLYAKSSACVMIVE